MEPYFSNKIKGENPLFSALTLKCGVKSVKSGAGKFSVAYCSMFLYNTLLWAKRDTFDIMNPRERAIDRLAQQMDLFECSKSMSTTKLRRQERAFLKHAALGGFALQEYVWAQKIWELYLEKL